MSYRQYLQYIAVFFDNFDNLFVLLFKFQVSPKHNLNLFCVFL